MEISDEALEGLSNSHAAARSVAQRKGMSPEQQNEYALKHFVNDGDTHFRNGVGLSQYLSGLDEEQAKQPRGMYADAVNRSFDRPVISTKAAAGVLGHMPQDDGSGYITPRQFMQEKANAVGALFIKKFEENTKAPAPESIVKIAATLADAAAKQTDEVAGVLAGTLSTNVPGVLSTAEQLRSLVASHAPSGPNAAQAHRTASEDAAMREKYGRDAEFMLTEAGNRNHEAQRVSELWSAQDKNYVPASGAAQLQRAIAPFISGAYNRVTGSDNSRVGEPWQEFAMMNRPDGKLEYAAQMYNRGNGDENYTGPISIYNSENRPKYGLYEMGGNPMGLANAMSESQSFPMAAWHQNVGYPLMEVGTHIGNFLGGGDSNHLDNIRQLRAAYNRITPVMPDGANPDEFHRLGKEVNATTTALTGMPSATLGPKFADTYNATIGKATEAMGMEPMKRTYLSPAAQTLVEVPAEMIADPANLAFNVGGPILAGATKGGSHMIRGLMKAPFRIMDDVVEETGVEGPAINAATSSLGDYFHPEQENLLMGSMDPNTPGFDEKVQEASTNARQRQMDAAQQYGKLIGKKPSPYKESSTRTDIPWMISR